MFKIKRTKPKFFILEAPVHEYLCGVSAFRLHRTPPQVLALCMYLPDISLRTDKIRIARHPELFGDLELPIHVLTTDAAQHRSSKSVVMHLWSGELPSGSFMENELDITLATPEFTLLTMAPHVSRVHLLMAAYELCGDFSVYRPAPEVQRELDRLHAAGALNGNAAWRQVHSTNGAPSTLWRHDPLLEVGALQRFAAQTEGMRGHKALAWVAERVTGIASSPLEVQASILFGLSRALGGEGFGPFENNKRIPLSPGARKLAGQETCYADLYFEATDAHPPLDIECHGHLAHDGAVKGELDANRALALQSMGIEVALLTHEQLANPGRFDAAADHIAAKLGRERKPKTPRMQEKQAELMRQLFIDWETLGS